MTTEAKLDPNLYGAIRCVDQNYRHKSSSIDQPCSIGEGTKIWHHTHVMAGAQIGGHCNIGQNCFVDREAVIGDHCKLQNNVSIYSRVTLEDYVFCGPSCVFTNVINPRCEVERKDEFRPTVVRRGASIGANATIVCGVTVGRYAFIGAGAVVREPVPDYGLVVGVPAKQIGWMTRHGAVIKLQELAAYWSARARSVKELQELVTSAIYMQREQHVPVIRRCPISGWQYTFEIDVERGWAEGRAQLVTMRCLDRGEDDPLMVEP